MQLNLNFNPFPEIKTNRTILRAISQEDAPALFFLRSDPRVLQYLDRLPMSAEKECEKFISNMQAQVNSGDSIAWAIALKDHPSEMIGTISFWKIHKEHFRAEVGYLLNPDHWNKGIMKEVLDAAINFGFKNMNLHSIEANINPNNAASSTLLKKCNFIKEGYFRESYYFNGVFTDSEIWSLIKS